MPSSYLYTIHLTVIFFHKSSTVRCRTEGVKDILSAHFEIQCFGRLLQYCLVYIHCSLKIKMQKELSTTMCNIISVISDLENRQRVNKNK